MIVDLADRRNDSCCAAESALLELALLDLGQKNLSLYDLHSKIVLSHVVDGTACDGRKDAFGSGDDQCVVLIYQKNVGAACLLQFGPCCGIQIDVLRETFLVRVYDRMQAHRVVKSGFNVACSSRCSAVIVTDADNDRLRAALEVRSYGRCEDTEHIIISGLNADHGADSEHERPYIKCCASAVRRYPRFISLNGCLDCLNKSVYGERRHLKTERRIIHSLRVEIGTETYDMSVFCLVSLQALKD